MTPLTKVGAILAATSLCLSQVGLAQSSAEAPTDAPSGAVVSPHAAGSDLGALRRMIENGRASDALLKLDALATVPSAPPGVQSLRGLALYVLNRMPQADAAYAAALLANPGDEESRQMRGLTLFRMGKPAEAIPLLEASRVSIDRGTATGRAVPDASKNGERYGERDLQASQTGQGVKGPAAPTAQSKADPNYVLALCYLDTRRYDDARHAFAAQYGFAPDSAAAYLLAARMLLRREYLPIARESAEKALQLDPKLPLAHALLGEIALAGNHLEEAIEQLSAEKEEDPLEPSVYDRLGDAYSRAGRYPEAQAALQQAVLLEPQMTGPYILLGKVMLKRQDAVGAATYLEHAKAMDPSNYMTRSLLSQAYRAMGRGEEASQEMQAAEQLQAANEPKLVTPK